GSEIGPRDGNESGPGIGTPAGTSWSHDHCQSQCGPPVAAAAPAGAPAPPPKHAEVQIHVQSSGRPLTPGSAGAGAASGASVTWLTTSAPAPLTWTTGPSSPGLLIRIETLTLVGCV